MKTSIAQRVHKNRKTTLQDRSEVFPERFARRIAYIKRNVEYDLLKANIVSYQVAVVEDVSIGAPISYVTKDQILNNPIANKVWDDFEIWAEKNGLEVGFVTSSRDGIPHVIVNIDGDDFANCTFFTVFDQCFVTQRSSGFFKSVLKLFQRH